MAVMAYQSQQVPGEKGLNSGSAEPFWFGQSPGTVLFPLGSAPPCPQALPLPLPGSAPSCHHVQPLLWGWRPARAVVCGSLREGCGITEGGAAEIVLLEAGRSSPE